jgi:hypothetical protein
MIQVMKRKYFVKFVETNHHSNTKQNKNYKDYQKKSKHI